MSLDKIGVILLAGSPSSPDIDPEGKLASRAMVDISGRTMIQYVVDALRGSQYVDNIVAIGNVQAGGIDKVLEPAGSMVENITKALPEVGGGEHVLVVCADIPLLTSEAIDDFIENAIKLDAELVYPIIERKVCERAYPGLHRTYAKTGDGSFTGGNITLVKRDFYITYSDTISAAFKARKKPFELARMIGYGVLLRAILAQIIPSIMPVKMLEEAISRLVGAKIVSYNTKYAEIGEDVDKKEDVEAVRTILANRLAVDKQ